MPLISSRSNDLDELTVLSNLASSTTDYGEGGIGQHRPDRPSNGVEVMSIVGVEAHDDLARLADPCVQGINETGSLTRHDPHARVCRSDMSGLVRTPIGDDDDLKSVDALLKD
jgi:hypothetical protein